MGYWLIWWSAFYTRGRHASWQLTKEAAMDELTRTLRTHDLETLRIRRMVWIYSPR